MFEILLLYMAQHGSRDSSIFLFLFHLLYILINLIKAVHLKPLMTICLTLSHCGLLIRRIKSDLLTAIIKWSQLAPIKPHGSRASIQSSVKFLFHLHIISLPWFIFFSQLTICVLSCGTTINFLCPLAQDRAPLDSRVTLKHHVWLNITCDSWRLSL